MVTNYSCKTCFEGVVDQAYGSIDILDRMVDQLPELLANAERGSKELHVYGNKLLEHVAPILAICGVRINMVDSHA